MSETIAQNAHHRISCMVRSRITALQTAIQDDDTGEVVTDDNTQAEIRELAKITAELAKADAAYQQFRLNEKLSQYSRGVTNGGLTDAASVLGRALTQAVGALVDGIRAAAYIRQGKNPDLNG